MSKHLIKQLDREIDTLRSQVWYLNDVLGKINDWLEEEIEHNEGRSECATSLLEQIKKWENEDENLD